MRLSCFILISLATLAAQCNQQRPDQTANTSTNQSQQINQSPSESQQECDFTAHQPLRLTSTLGSPAISMPRPEYPAEAKALKLEGTIRVKLLINVHSGLVEQACVIEGDKILGQAAQAAALKIKVSPYNEYIRNRYNYVESVVSYNFAS